MLKDNDKKPYRINSKTNFFNLFPRLVWSIVNKFKYRTLYFLDTNIIIGSTLDKRIKRLYISNKKLVLSEPIYYELKKDKENACLESIKKRTKLTSINILKELFPETCPLYYSFISGMYNPANVNNPSFWTEGYLGKIIHKQTTSNLDSFWEKRMNKIQRSLSSTNIFGEKLDSEENIINQSQLKALTKKKREIKNDSERIMVDYKNTALAFIYTMFFDCNVKLVTADYDVVYAFLNLVDHLVQEIVFVELILKEMENNEDIIKELKTNKKVTIYIKKEDFDDLENQLRMEFLNRDWKKSGFKFEIKFWDAKQQKYFTPISVNFNSTIVNRFKEARGGHDCPFVKNTGYLNWLTFKWFWPPSEEFAIRNNLIKFEIAKKNDTCNTTRKVPWVVHNTECYFSSLDQAGRLHELSCFNDSIP